MIGGENKDEGDIQPIEYTDPFADQKKFILENCITSGARIVKLLVVKQGYANPTETSERVPVLVEAGYVLADPDVKGVEDGVIVANDVEKIGIRLGIVDYQKEILDRAVDENQSVYPLTWTPNFTTASQTEAWYIGKKQ